MSNATTVLLCGVGGQGTILAADLLARTALASNYDVKVSEIHGMSQRGGAVTTVVRFGTEPVATMVADHGCVDCVVSFETTEALRNLPFVREGGYLLVADEDIKPLPVLTGKAGMPENAREKVATSTSVNVVLLGALATRLDFSEEVWKEVISKRVPPKTVEANLRAFDAGYEFARKGAE